MICSRIVSDGNKDDEAKVLDRVWACDWVDFRRIDGSSIIHPRRCVISQFIDLCVADYCRKGSENNCVLSIVGDVNGNDRNIGDGTTGHLRDKCCRPQL
jgi:hypothetical protein